MAASATPLNSAGSAAESARRSLARNFLAGALCSIVMVAYAGSCANLIFSGSLSVFGSQGMLAALVSTVIAVLVVSRFSSFNLSLGGPDSNPSAILAVTTAAIAARIIRESGRGDPTLLPTVLMFVFSSALGCGLLIVLIGERRLGRYMRYIPHPVIGGFLGGTGYLLLAGGYTMLTGAPVGRDFLAPLGHVPPIAWGTALATAVAMAILMRRLRHHLVIPLVLLGGVIGFYVVLAFSGHSLADARASDLMMEPVRLGAWANTLHFPYASVRWNLILGHWNDFAVMTVVVIITCLLNATSIDITVGADVDMDRELKALGIANILSGLAGGVVVVNSFNRTVLNQRSGADSPWAARFCAGLIVILVVVAPGLVGFIPRPVLTGLILYLGLSLVIAWIWDARRTMPISDYLIVVSIVVIVATMGVVTGVLLGVVIACLNFVFAFSKSSAVKYVFTAANRHSNVERKPHEARCLRESGQCLRGFVLQGFLFFGTASSVLEEVRRVLGGARFVLLDFWFVREIDTSSVFALRKIRNLSAEKGVTLVISGVSPQLASRFLHANFDLDDPSLRVFPDLDHALEWCENEIIAAEKFTTGPFAPMTGVLTRFREGPMGPYFEPVVFRAGDCVVRQDDVSDALFVVDSGQVSIYLKGDPASGATRFNRRMRTYGVGTVVGEMGFYTDDRRSAEIVADVDSVLLRLSRERMLAFEREHAAVAQDFHRYVIFTMALRLRAANEEIRLLL